MIKPSLKSLGHEILEADTQTGYVKMIYRFSTDKRTSLDEMIIRQGIGKSGDKIKKFESKTVDGLTIYEVTTETINPKSEEIISSFAKANETGLQKIFKDTKMILFLLLLIVAIVYFVKRKG